MSRIVKCLCGGDVTTIADVPNLAAEKASTDFSPYMHTRDGLGVCWICPKCEVLARTAIEHLVKVFGELAPYIHLANKMPRAK